MARKSLLADSVWKTESDERRTTMLAEAEGERVNAFTDLVILIENMSEDIAEQHTKPLVATRAETAFLNQLHQGLDGNGGRITALFANGYANPAQPQALEAAEQRAIDAEASRDHLRGEVRRASDLQANLDLANDEIARIQRALDEARRNSDQPNPLAGQVAELQGKLTTANSEKEAAEAEVTRIQGELDQAVADKEVADTSADLWHQKAVELGYVESDSQSDPDPEPEPDDNVVPGMQESPVPNRERRRLRDVLPGHGRNQGAQNGGEE